MVPGSLIIVLGDNVIVPGENSIVLGEVVIVPGTGLIVLGKNLSVGSGGIVSNENLTVSGKDIKVDNVDSVALAVTG